MASVDTVTEMTYIPSRTALKKINELQAEMNLMKTRHIKLLASSKTRYEDALEDNLRHYTDVLDQFRKHAKSRLRIHKESIRELKEENDKLSERLRIAEEELAQQEEAREAALADIIAEKEAAEERLKEVQEALEAEEKAKVEVEAELDKVRAQLAEQEKAVDDLKLEHERALEAEKSTQSELEQKIADLEDKLASGASTLDAEARLALEKAEAQELRIKELESEMEEAQANTTRVQGELEESQAELAKLREQLDAKERELLENSEAADKLERLTQERDGLKEELALLQGGAEMDQVFKDKLEKKNKELETLRGELETLQGKLKAAEESMGEAKDSGDGVTVDPKTLEELGQLREENARIKGELEELRSKKAEAPAVFTSPVVTRQRHISKTVTKADPNWKPLDKAGIRAALPGKLLKKKKEIDHAMEQRIKKLNEYGTEVSDASHALKAEVAQFQKEKQDYKDNEDRKMMLLEKYKLTELKNEDGTPRNLKKSDITRIKRMLELSRENAKLGMEVKKGRAEHKEKIKEREQLKAKINQAKADLERLKENAGSSEDVEAKQAELKALSQEQVDLIANMKSIVGPLETSYKQFSEQERERKAILARYGFDSSIDKSELRDMVNLFETQADEVKRLQEVHTTIKDEKRPAVLTMKKKEKVMQMELAKLKEAREKLKGMIHKAAARIQDAHNKKKMIEVEEKVAVDYQVQLDQAGNEVPVGSIPLPGSVPNGTTDPSAVTGSAGSASAGSAPEGKSASGSGEGESGSSETPSGGWMGLSGSGGGGGGASSEELAKLQAEKQSLAAAGDEMKKENAELTEKLTKYKVKLRELLTREKARKEADSQGAQAGAAERQALEAQIAEMETARESMATEHKAKLEAMSQEAQSKLTALQAEADKAAEEHAAALKSAQGKLGEQLTAAQSSLAETRQALETQQQKSAQLTEELGAERKKNEELTASNADSAAALSAVNEAKDKLSEELASKTQEAAGLTENLTAATTQVTQLATTVQEKDKSLGELSEAKKQLEEQLAAEKSKAADLASTLEDERKKTDTLSEQVRVEADRRKYFQFEYEAVKGKIRVYCRVRPMLGFEKKNNEVTCLRKGRNAWSMEVNVPSKDHLGTVKDDWREFSMDQVFYPGVNGSQEEVFEETVTFAEMACQGINCCVFAYGQSGTGKTYTMAGDDDNPGLKPRMVRKVFEVCEENKELYDYSISMYLVESYMSQLEDTLWKLQQYKKHGRRWKGKEEPPDLKIRIARKKVRVENINTQAYDSAEDMINDLNLAEDLRISRKTGLNEKSSRSHLIMTMVIEAVDKKTKRKLHGKLSLVDLAGSERWDKTNVEGLSKKERDLMVEEGKSINESLRMLKNIFRILGTRNDPNKKGKKKEVAVYRGNPLTELMQDSLGGKARTLMFVNVGPASSNLTETLDSMSYAGFVNNITNEVADADADYEEEIRMLQLTLDAWKAKYPGENIVVSGTSEKDRDKD